MKFTELKDSLKKCVLSNYFLFGDDIFVMYNALKQIAAAATGNFGNINNITFSSDSNFTIDDLVNACLSMPFGDCKRLVIVKSTKIKKTDAALPQFIELLKNLPASACIVFFAAEQDDFFDIIKPHCNAVDCSRLPATIICAYIESEVKKSGCQISKNDAELVANLCNNEMGKVAGEVTKLCLLAGKNGEVTQELIIDTIEKTDEYKIYELGDRLGKKDASGAMHILNVLLADKEIKNAILPSLYSLFSRALFASVTQDDALVASELKVKPYAIAKARELGRHFTQSALRRACSLILQAEEDFKTGKMGIDGAVFNVITKILL